MKYSLINIVHLMIAFVAANSEDNVCQTLACNETASHILNNMDTNVEPCDNFHKFVCGGFLQKTIIPNDKTTIDAFKITEQIVKEQLKSSMEESSRSDEPKPFRLVKDFYKSCMNQEVIESRGYKPLQDKLKALGGWPVLEGQEWNETNFTWIESIYKFRKVGYTKNYFLNLFVDTNSEKTDEKVLVLDQPMQASLRSRMIEGMNNTRMRAYYKYIVDSAVMLGASRDNAIAELKESFDFEMELAKITVPKSELRNLTLRYNPMTVAELSTKYPSIPWKEYINNMLAPHVTIDDSEIVDVTTPGVISKFEKLMNETPKRVLANYVMWKAVQYSIVYVFTRDMEKTLLKYLRNSNGKIKLGPQWMRCVNKVYNLRSTHALYARKYFNETSRNSAIELVDRIKNIFHKTLQTIDWMDEETKKSALDKAATMSTVIGYLDELIDDDKLEEFYKNLEFDDNNYLENQLKLNLFEEDRKNRDFRKTVENNDWTNEYVASVNAFYRSSENSIFFPAGILQGIFFNDDRPKYMNYGAIGVIISHEMTHAFDDEGRQLDEKGNFGDWWTPYTKNEYVRKAQCIIDQYSNYTVEENGKKLDGILTLNENIADNGGLKIAYSAYKDWLKRHGKEQSLPGLQFNSQQMFWISAANMWCSKIRPEKFTANIAYASHAPDEFRNIGSLSNLPEFAQDFNCSIGSKMNPGKKCTFW